MIHTNEPWPVFTDIATTMTPDPEGPPVAILSWDDYIRARACVNACARIETSLLEEFPGGINGLSNIAIAKQRDDLMADRDTWKERYEFSVQERSKLEKQVEGLINQLSDHQRQAATGRAIDRACEELPEGFDLHVECEKNAGTIRLYHPDGEEESEDLYCDSGLAGAIDNAINIAAASAESGLVKGCHRSHPHENMSEECERKTVAARDANHSAVGIVDCGECPSVLGCFGTCMKGGAE